MGAVVCSGVVTLSSFTKAVLSVASLAFSISAAPADIVCSSTLVQKGQWGYNKQTSDRCEGEYFQVAANPGYSSVLRVVSLVSGFGEADPQHSQTLRVQWKKPSPSDTVTLTVTSLRPEHYYRMDAVVDASQASAYEWPTTFTRHEGMRPYELAVLAQTSRGLLLPVTVGAQKDPKAPPSPFLVIRATKPLNDLQYTIRRIDATAPPKVLPAPKPVPVTGEFITIPLTLPRAGDYNFTATAHLKDGKLVGLPLTFHYVD